MPVIRVSTCRAGPSSISAPSLSSESSSSEAIWYELINKADTALNTVACIPYALQGDQLEAIRWYLEDYAQNDPLATGRARKAKGILLDYGRTLSSSIDWHKLYSPNERQEDLVLEIQAAGNDGLDQTPWELLEDPDLWQRATPRTVRVVRVYETEKIHQKQSCYGSQEQGDLQVNLLVVAARHDPDNDIPHRLVSRILHDKMLAAASKTSKKITLDIVRPSTWDTFCNHLNLHPKGHYDVVHFDLHGIEDSTGKSVYFSLESHILQREADQHTRTHLAFIKADLEGAVTFQPDLIPASQVASVLVVHGVQQVVLNACRSAKGFGLEQNIALALMNAGVQVCAAMTHRIISKAVEIYTSVLYEALLVHNVTLTNAAITGRAALRRHKERISGYGDQVEVDDWLVPIVYTASYPALDQPCPGLDDVDFGEKEETEDFPFGRESDILRLESTLLITKKAVLVTGQSGVGKTFLLQHLQHWWKRTRLSTASHYAQLSRQSAWNIEGLFKYIHGSLFPGKPFGGREATIHFLKDNRCLLIFDSLESVDLSNKSRSRAFHREFPQFLRSLHGGKTMILIASRSSENWLSDCTVTHPLRGIGTMGGMLLLRENIGSIGGENTLSVEKSSDEIKALEQMVKLVDANPMAILLLAAVFKHLDMSPEAMLAHLIAGGAIPEFNSEVFEEHEGFRGLAQLQDIIDSVDPTGFSAFLPVQILAPFWKLLPSNDVTLYAACYCRKMRSLEFPALGSGQSAQLLMQGIKELAASSGWPLPDVVGEDGNGSDLMSLLQSAIDADHSNRPSLFPPYVSMDDAILSVEGMELEALLGFTPSLETSVQHILEPLKKAHFLQSVDDALVPTHELARGYLSISPCLPILLRSHYVYREDWHNIGSASRLAYSYYYAYRTKGFPFSQMYFSPTWALFRQSLALDFSNFLGASATTFSGKNENREILLEHTVLSRMLSIIHRGIGNDPGRLNIIQGLWAKAIEFNLHNEEILLSQRPSTDASFLGPLRRNLTSWLWQNFGTAEGSLYADGTDEGQYRETVLFGLRSITLELALQMVTADRHDNPDKKSSFLPLAERLFLAMKRDGIPSDLDQSFWTKSLDYFLFVVKAAGTQGVDMDMAQFWSKREEWVSFVEGQGKAGASDSPEIKRDWTTTLEMDLLAKHSHSARIVTPMLEGREALRDGRLADARRIVTEAIRSEALDANDDMANKASLLQLLSEIDEMSGEWSDALRNFDQANVITDGIAMRQNGTVGLGFKQRFWREFKRQELLGKIKEERKI